MHSRPSSAASLVSAPARAPRAAFSLGSALALGLLALSSSLAGCSLYFEQDPPGQPRDAGVMDGYYPPWLPDDAWVPSDASPADAWMWPEAPRVPGVDFWMPIPTNLYGSSDIYLELTWTYEGREPRHQIVHIPEDAYSISVADEDAYMLHATLFNDDRWLASTTRREGCPADSRMTQPSQVIEVPNDVPTIQGAIDISSEGAIIYVHPGEYVEQLVLKPHLRLIGAGAHRTTIRPPAPATGSLIELGESDDVVIRGFTLEDSVDPGVDGCSADGSFTCPASMYDAAVRAESFLEQEDGLYCGASLVLTHNIFANNDNAVNLSRQAVAAIVNNVFTYNTNGVLALEHHGTSLIAGNTFYEVERYATVGLFTSLNLVANVFEAVGTILGDGDGLIRDYATCNAYGEVEAAGQALDQDGNVNREIRFLNASGDDLRLEDGSDSWDIGCYNSFTGPYFDLVPGAYGGPQGDWYEGDIEPGDFDLLFGAI